MTVQILPEHIRAARGWLHWSAEDLSQKSGVAMNTIARIERGFNKPRAGTIERITAAFENAGIEILHDGIRDVSMLSTAV